MILYGIPNCDKVRKAKNALQEQNIEFEFHDFKKLGIDKQILSLWCEKVDYKNILNRKSTTWRNLDSTDKENVTKQKAIELMVKNPTLIKRPVIVNDSEVFIGIQDFNANIS